MKKMGLPTMLINSYDDLEDEVCMCENSYQGLMFAIGLCK